MHTRLLRFAVHHPRVTLALAFLITALALLFIPRIQLRLDGRSLVPANEPLLAANDRAAAIFELKDIVVISLVAGGDNGMLSADGLERIGRVSHELQGLKGIVPGTVMSLSTMPLLRSNGGMIHPQPVIGNAPVSADQALRVREDIAALGLDNGIILSTEGKSAAIYAFAAADANREQLLEQVQGIAARNHDTDFDIYIGGNALAQAELGRSVAVDLFLLVPFLIVALMILISVVFRNINAALVSLMEIGLSLVWTIGLMGLLGESVFITTLALPVVLIAIGVTDDIYGLNRYIGIRRKAPVGWTHQDIIVAAFGSVSKPVMLTALTTMSGLVSLSFADLEPLRVFGVFGAVAIGLSTLFTFTVVPAFLALWPLTLREGSARSNRRIAKVAIRILDMVERIGPRKVVLGVLVAGIGAFALVTNLRIDDSWVQNLAPGSDVARGDHFINKYMGGSTTVEFALETEQEGGFRHPEYLRALAIVEDSLAKVPRVGAVQSTYTDILRITAILRGVPYNEFRRRIASGEVVLSRDDIEGALAVDEVLDRPHLGVYMTPDSKHARITAFVHGADYERLKPVFDAADAAMISVGGGLVATPFGDGWISSLTVKLLVEGQIVSIAFAALADLLLVALMLRSLRTACVAVLPVIAGVLFTFVTLVVFDYPLGIASSMFASIALGIGVDYSIHLAVESREACRRSANLWIALRRSYSMTAPSIIVSACTITLGFGVLVLSSVVPNRMLGLLVCISLSICAFMTLVLVPGLADIFNIRRTVPLPEFSETAQDARLMEMMASVETQGQGLTNEGAV